MSDDFRDRLPDADRIRDRIREQRRDEYSETSAENKKGDVSADASFEQKVGADDPTTGSLKWENVVDDPTASNLKWENVKDADVDQDAFMKLDDIVGESAEGGASLKLGDVEEMVEGAAGVVDHKADDFAEQPSLDALNDSARGAVDHQTDDFTERPTPGAETVHLSLADESPGSEPDGYMRIGEILGESAGATGADSILTNNENITEWKADSVAPDGESDSILTQNENISGVLADSNPTPLVGAFDDITGGGDPEPSGKQIDQTTPVVGDAADMKMELGLDKSSPKMESGVTVGNNFEEVKAVASDPDNQDAFKVEIEGVDAGHVVDPLADPVGDALAPLDGGDELISMPELDDAVDAVDAASPSFDDESLDGV